MKSILALSLLFLSLAASADPLTQAPATSVVVGGQHILADRNQMTAYVFDKDAGNVSSCYGGCASEWPPILVQSSEHVIAPFGTTVRKDGTLQLTYQNRPIYLFDEDSKVGDTTGDGLGGIWHIIRLD